MEMDNSTHQTKKKNPLSNHIKAWWIIPIHLAASLALTLVLTLWVDGRAFRRNDIDEKPPSVTHITQSDVTTWVSAALIVVRLLAGSWLTIIGWRLAFLYLELQGASLAELDWIINYRIPPLFGSKYTSLMLCAWILFLLATPTQLAAPILTGAVSWSPGIVRSAPQSVGVDQPGRYCRPENNYFDPYYWHNVALNSRAYEAYMSLGFASIASVENFNNPYAPIYRRQTPSLPKTVVNSTIANITLPYFKFESSLEWITTKEDFENDGQILKKVVDDGAFSLGIMGRNPFHEGTDPGRLAIVNTKKWIPTVSWDTYPASTTQAGSKLLVVSLNNYEKCDEPRQAVGSIPQAYRYESATSGCAIFARFNYTAGAFTCENCPTVANGVVEASPTGNWTAAPDALTEEAIAMMPDVLFYMRIANVSSGSLHDNMENYSMGMLIVAYQASWNALAHSWSDEHTAPTTMRIPVSVLFASVSAGRLWAWFTINTLLTLSGVLLGMLQSRSRCKTVRNPQVAALLIDTTRLVRQDGTGLFNALDWEKNAKKSRLRLVVDAGEEELHQRVYLEAEGESGVELQQVDTQVQIVSEESSSSVLSLLPSVSS